MTKLGIRYYDPTLGRFTQPDPTGQDPHYTYAGNSPCSYVDPTGVSFRCSLAAGAAAALGAAAGGGVAIYLGPAIQAAGAAAVGAFVYGFVYEACESDAETSHGRAMDGLRGGAENLIAAGFVALGGALLNAAQG